MIAPETYQQYFTPLLIHQQNHKPAWHSLGTLWFMHNHLQRPFLENWNPAATRRRRQSSELTKSRLRGRREGSPTLQRNSSSGGRKKSPKDIHKLYGSGGFENRLGSLSAKLTLARYNSQKYKRRSPHHENAVPRARTAPCRLNRVSSTVGSILPSETYQRTEYRSPFKQYNVPSAPSHPLRQMTSATCLNSSSSGDEGSVSHSEVNKPYSSDLYRTTLRPPEISRPSHYHLSNHNSSAIFCAPTGSSTRTGVYLTSLTNEAASKQQESSKPAQRKLWSNFKKKVLKRR